MYYLYGFVQQYRIFSLVSNTHHTPTQYLPFYGEREIIHRNIRLDRPCTTVTGIQL